MEKQLKEVSKRNDRLKRLIAEKELELAILRELRDKVNLGSRQSFNCSKVDQKRL